MPERPEKNPPGKAAPARAEKPFCDAAVKLGVVSPAQLEQAIEEQRRRTAAGKTDPIGFVLLEMGLIESSDIQKIREEEHRNAPAGQPAQPRPKRPSGPSAAQGANKAPVRPSPEKDGQNPDDMTEEQREDLFAKLALKLGFITRKNLDDCLAAQKKSADLGMKDPLSFILSDRGLLTPEQEKRINAEIKKTGPPPAVPGYEIIEELGAGAMGVVYKVRQISLDRVVALKVIPKSAFSGRKYHDRFLQESQNAARLNHPNIVKSIDAGETDRHYYFAMELIEGKTLQQRIREQKRLAEGVALDYAQQIANALQHAGQAGIVHRDIKPENLLIDTAENRIKIADMGLARPAEGDEPGSARKTQGNPLYLSPEQALRKQPDARSDMYSFGAVMYHMLVGAPPFEGDNPAQILKKHVEEEPQAPRARVPRISEEMNRIVLKMLSKKPEDRYQDASSLLADLDALRKAGPGRTTDASARVTGRPAARKAGAFPLIPAAVVGALVVVAIIAAVVMSGGSSGDGDKTPDQGSGKGAKGFGTDGDSSSNPADEREEAAKTAFDKARAFEEKNPDSYKEILSGYRQILDRFPRTAAWTLAKEAAAETEARQSRIASQKIEETLSRARELAGENRFKEALDLLASAKTMESSSKYEKTIRDAEDEIRENAVKARDTLARQAAEAADRGEWDVAADLLSRVESFGMPGLYDAVKPLAEQYAREKKNAAHLEIHSKLLGKIAESGLEAGLQFLSEELSRNQDYDLKEKLRRDIMNIDRAKAVRAAVISTVSRGSEKRLLRFNSGDAVFGTVEASGDALKVRGSGGERLIPVASLAASDVKALSRMDDSSVACFAWYVLGDAAWVFAAAGGDPDKAAGETGELARLAAACVRRRFAADLDSFSTSKSPSSADAIVARYGGLHAFLRRESEVRALFAQMNPKTANPFVFGRAAAPGSLSPDDVSLEYDFASQFGCSHFITTGGAWSASSGMLEVSPSPSGQTDAFLPGVWTWFRAKAQVVLQTPVKGFGFNFFQQPDGRRYAFEVREAGGNLVICFRFSPRGVPAMFLLGSPAVVENPDLEGFHTVMVEVEGDKIRGTFDDSSITVDADDFKAASEQGHEPLKSGRLGLRAASRVLVNTLSIEGRPEAQWLSCIPGPGAAQALAAGKPAPLLEGVSMRGVDKLAGRAALQPGSLRLDGPFSAVSHMSGTMCDLGRAGEISFVVKRLGSTGFALIGFGFGTLSRAVVLKPDSAEEQPASLPLDLPSFDAPFAPGQPVRISLRSDGTGVSFWANGIRKFGLTREEISNWRGGLFHTFGFGLGCAGGDFEFSEPVLTRP